VLAVYVNSPLYTSNPGEQTISHDAPSPRTMLPSPSMTPLHVVMFFPTVGTTRPAHDGNWLFTMVTSVTVVTEAVGERVKAYVAAHAIVQLAPWTKANVPPFKLFTVVVPDAVQVAYWLWRKPCCTKQSGPVAPSYS